ncbi:MAG TPA: hypothetical protein VHC63_06585 [Acidimicrobiales bacterium]|nr:hypothetical protein [Acidimicrobiales bacterium]
MKRIRVGAALATIALAALYGVPGAPARAAESAAWLSIPGAPPLFHLSGIAPGQGEAATFTVTNPNAFPVEFALAVRDLRSDDRGCDRPEKQAGDTTCGLGGGELQNDLQLSLSVPDDSDRAVHVDTLDDWSDQYAVDSVPLAAQESRTYAVADLLPRSSTNLTQSDLVSFVFEMRIEEVAGGTSVAGAQITRVQGTPALGATGLDVKRLVAPALELIAAGLVLVVIQQIRLTRRHT